ARGRVMTFVDSPSIQLRRSVGIYPQFQINMDNPIDRLRFHLRHYKSNFYSVRRTSQIRLNLNKILSLNVGRGLQERLVPVLDLIDGKGAVFPELFMFRQRGQSLVDERGKVTILDKGLKGYDYAKELTKNEGEYFRFIEDEIRLRLSDEKEGEVNK